MLLREKVLLEDLVKLYLSTHQAVSQVQIFGLSLACHYDRVAVGAQYDQKLRSAKS